MMEQLIPIMNRLQDALMMISTNSNVIDLPQIVVVGSQSVGKSSVLESLVGSDFLPRGVGIVTRRPLILHLEHIDEGEPHGEFKHSGQRRFSDFNEIRLEIERETDRIGGKNVTNNPISLKIYSQNVINLTLVDLPGLTKVPVGDQPADIEVQIRSMVMEYVLRPNCIMLAVTAANTDLANSDSLQLAREVDPDGVRTVGVITKCDLMDQGTDAMDMLMGKIYPLKKGYVGIVCRSQKNIQDKKHIKDALKEEEKYFRTHPSYRHIAQRCGTKYLAQSLNQILMSHIRDCLPHLKTRIVSLIHDTEQELQGYGDPILEARGNPGALLLHFFSKFARNFQDCIDGTLVSSHSAVELTGGARINYIFHDWYCNTIMSFFPLQDLSDHEIRTAIRNCTGPKAALFVPEGAFEILVKKQIRKLEPPSLQCVDQVYEELQKIVETCELPEMSRFSNLKERILDVVRGVLKRCLAPANQMIQNLIQLELAYINTNHPDFMGAHSLPAPYKEEKDGAAPDTMNSMYSGERQLTPDDLAYMTSEMSANNMVQQGGFFSFLKGGSKATRTDGRSDSVHFPMTAQCNTNGSQQGPATPSTTVAGMTVNAGNASAVHSSTPASASSSSSGVATQEGGTRSHTAAKGPSSITGFNRLSMFNPSGLYSKRRHENNGMNNMTGNYGIQLPAVPGIVSPSEYPSEREMIETDLIKALINSYFCIVRKTITDSVPKAIMYFMVNTAKDVIQRELVSQLYREELFGELLKEADDIAERRSRCKDLRKKLLKASDILSQIRDYNIGD